VIKSVHLKWFFLQVPVDEMTFELKCFEVVEALRVADKLRGSFVLTVSGSIGSGPVEEQGPVAEQGFQNYSTFLHKAETGPIIAPMTNSSTEPAWPPVPRTPWNNKRDTCECHWGRRSDFFYSKRS
jgi:hypothetical protein